MFFFNPGHVWGENGSSLTYLTPKLAFVSLNNYFISLSGSDLNTRISNKEQWKIISSKLQQKLPIASLFVPLICKRSALQCQNQLPKKASIAFK